MDIIDEILDGFIDWYKDLLIILLFVFTPILLYMNVMYVYNIENIHRSIEQELLLKMEFYNDIYN